MRMQSARAQGAGQHVKARTGVGQKKRMRKSVLMLQRWERKAQIFRMEEASYSYNVGADSQIGETDPSGQRKRDKEPGKRKVT